MAFHTLDLATAASMTEIAEESCGFITRAAWSQAAGALAVAYGGGVLLWRGGFGGEADARFEHSAPIKDVAFSHAGKWLAAASSDTFVYLLDAQLKVITSFQAANAVDCAAVSPDDRFIAAGCANGTIQHIDLKTGERQDIPAHDAEISRMRFLSNTLLLSGSRDGSLKLWNLNDKAVIDSVQRTAERDQAIWAQRPGSAQEKEILHLLPLPIWVRDIAISGDQAAVAWKDGLVTLYSLKDRKLSALRTLEAHENGVDAAAFSSDGSLLASGGRDDLIKLWNAATGDLLTTLSSHDKPVLTLTFAVNDLFLISGSGDNTLKLWGVEH